MPAPIGRSRQIRPHLEQRFGQDSLTAIRGVHANSAAFGQESGLVIVHRHPGSHRISLSAGGRQYLRCASNKASLGHGPSLHHRTLSVNPNALLIATAQLSDTVSKARLLPHGNPTSVAFLLPSKAGMPALTGIGPDRSLETFGLFRLLVYSYNVVRKIRLKEPR